MCIRIIVFIIIIKQSKCSVVIDKVFQNSVQLTDYCPEIGECMEGSHVMCTYYNQNHKMGPTCAGVEDATMTEEFAAILLDLINSIRSRAARGLAMGYGNQLLPRAYGLFRLQWDPELATLAQVWADQCIIQFDYCHSTKKFLDPGQLASVTRFVGDKWIPLSKRTQTSFHLPLGFNKEKRRYALQSSVRAWYATSEEIDADIITDRDSSWTEDLIKNPYLQIIEGSSTHMGCGTSAFKEYAFHNDTTNLLYNVIRLVCNFSSRVHDRRGIYNTVKPTTSDYTPQCGCPPGYDEDTGCLCYESSNETKACEIKGKPGKLQVVVVPIVTVEDYPRAYEDSMLDRKKKQLSKKNPNQGQVMVNRRVIPNRPLDQNLSITSLLKLPSRKLKKDTPLDKIKWDVAPRKDFSKSKNLLSNYLRKRRNFNLQNNLLNSGRDKNIRRSLPIESIQPPRDNFIKRNTYNNWKDGKKYNLIRRRNINSNIQASKVEDTKLFNLLNKLENEANKININKKDRSVLKSGIRKIFSAFKIAHLMNNNKNNIYNKKITNNKTLYEPFIENHKLTIYEDLLNNMSSRQINLKPRNISLISTKYQNNTHFINSFTGKEFKKLSYKNNPRRYLYHSPQTTQNIYNKEYLRNDLNSDEDILSDNRRIYYHNRINDIRRKLKAHYNNYLKSVSGLKIRPTFQASHLQLRKTLPNIKEYDVDAIRRDMIPYSSIYGSMERRLKLTRVNTPEQREIESFENERAEFPVFKHRRKKKKQQTVTNNNELLSTSSRKKEERKKSIKKRKKKAKYNKRFIKTTLKNVDSNMSDSKDSESKVKPVDIIVHIKMND